jgi:hypothetical protein
LESTFKVISPFIQPISSKQDYKTKKDEQNIKPAPQHILPALNPSVQKLERVDKGDISPVLDSALVQVEAAPSNHQNLVKSKKKGVSARKSVVVSVLNSSKAELTPSPLITKFRTPSKLSSEDCQLLESPSSTDCLNLLNYSRAVILSIPQLEREGVILNLIVPCSGWFDAFSGLCQKLLKISVESLATKSLGKT